ncbi:MAG: type IV secretion protein IcmC [Legionellales bacterium]|nr:type IV secretion protein IcmC [Legionellales bacterium]
MADAVQMLTNLASVQPNLYKLVTGAAYVIGLAFIFRALYHLKIYGELRTMMASQTGLKEPLAYLFVGTMLLYLPTGFSTVMQTAFGYDNVLAYTDWRTTSGSITGPGGVAILRLVQLVGAIAFVKGWMILARSAGQGGGAQGNTTGKGLTHIFGGVAGMNIVGTANVISSTLGVSFF